MSILKLSYECSIDKDERWQSVKWVCCKMCYKVYMYKVNGENYGTKNLHDQYSYVNLSIDIYS